MQALWIIGGALLGVALFLAVLYILLRLRFRAAMEKVGRDAALEGDPLIPPMWGSFRGAEHKYGRVKCDGVIALTSAALVFEPLAGKNRVRIERSELMGASLENSFLMALSPLRPILVCRLIDGNQVGFMVRDPQLWASALGLPPNK